MTDKRDSIAPPPLRLTIIKPDGKRLVVDCGNGIQQYIIERGREGAEKIPSIVHISDRLVSRRHCSLTWDGKSSWQVEDLKSRNGTHLDGKRLKKVTPVKSGKELRVGVSILRVEYGAAVTSIDDGDLGHKGDTLSRYRTASISDHTTIVATPDPEAGADEGTIVATSKNPKGGKKKAAQAAADTDDAGENTVLAAADTDGAGEDTVLASADTDGAEEKTIMAAAKTDGAEEKTVLAAAGRDHSPTIDSTVVARVLGASDGGNSGESAADTDATLVQSKIRSVTAVDDSDASASDAGAGGDHEASSPDPERADHDADEATGLPKTGNRRASDADEAIGLPNTGDRRVSGTRSSGRRAGDKGPGQEEFQRPKFARSRPEAISLRGIVKDMVEAELLPEGKAQSLCRRARDTGATFFCVLAKDQTVHNHEAIFQWVAESLGCELILDDKNLVERAVEANWLPFGAAERNGVLLLESDDPAIAPYATMVLCDVLINDWIARCTGSTPQVVVSPPQVFLAAVSRLRSRVTEQEDEDEIGVAINITWDQEQQILDSIENCDVPQVVDFFLHRAHIQGASDIHVEPTEEGLLIRNRLDGMLHEESLLPKAMHPEVTSRIKILSGMDVAEKRRPQDGRISALIRENPIDIRVSTYPTVYGEKIVMRLLDRTALRPSPEYLGIHDRDLRVLMDGLRLPNGLIMLSGPTGSGKTTTLYSCLGSIDKTSQNVLTIEDPVEYRLKGVHQMQVNDKIGLTFASGLRTILRQDPDVVMVGECRDIETSAMAIQAALTGHLVFSTIHANDSIGVITRLLDMKIDPFLVSSALTLSMAQRLVRTVCQNCKTLVDGSEYLEMLRNDGVSAERMSQLGIEIDPYMQYVHPIGCQNCRNSGYSGRQAVYEMFEMTNECRNLIMSDKFNADELREVARRHGMRSLVENGLGLIEEGKTTHTEVIRVLGESH